MKRYNTPHRSRVVKTRMTEEEYAEFAQRLSAYHMSQAEFIRQAITGAAIRPTITVSPVNDELLAAVGKLTAEYGRIGGNLNQIARTLNEWHSPYWNITAYINVNSPKSKEHWDCFFCTWCRFFNCTSNFYSSCFCKEEILLRVDF